MPLCQQLHPWTMQCCMQLGQVDDLRLMYIGIIAGVRLRVLLSVRGAVGAGAGVLPRDAAARD